MNKTHKSKWKTTASLVLLASLVSVGSASADVLFTDNFTFPSNPGGSQNMNVDINTGRQGGLLGTNLYLLNRQHHQAGNTGTDVGQPVVSDGNYVLVAINGDFQSSINIAQASTTTLTIQFTMYQKPSSSTDWCGFSLRNCNTADNAIPSFPVAGANEFGFLHRKNGGLQVFQNGGTGSAAGQAGWDTAGFAPSPNWKLVFTDTAGTGSAFVGNGSKVAFYNNNVLLGTITLGQNLRSSDLFMGWMCTSSATHAGIDNLQVDGTQGPVQVTTDTQQGNNPFTPSYTAETPSLIAGASPGTASGNFSNEGSGGTSVLTDGTIGTSGTIGGFATCGGAGPGSAGNTLIYALPNAGNGVDVTNIVTYSGWGDAGRFGQYYTVSYSTVAAPTTFIPITTVCFISGGRTGNNGGLQGAPASRVAITGTNGTLLCSGAANIKFDFSGPPNSGNFNNGYQGYSEIIVQGVNSTAPTPPPSPYLTQDTLPTRAETVVGDQVIFTAIYSNSPPASVQWLFISGGVTNIISGATSSTLMLNNVQLTNSGTYTLKAVNATNGAAAPSFSTAAPLAVGTAGTVGNVIVKYAGQAGPLTFYPAWSVDTNIDLIYGFPTDGSGNPGTATAGGGNFGVEAGVNGDPTILADGVLGSIKALMNSCGPGSGAGKSMTYTLNTVVATNGFDLTNITIYGGWPDDGRNEQKYQVLYSTVAAPATFSSIGTFDYNPTFSSGEPNANRVTLVPVSGALAQNVAAVQINWDLQGSQPKNGWEGYAEVSVNGTASAPRPVLTQDINPLTAEDVVGSSLILNAAFSGATGYQWQKNGTDIPGANSATLTLSNLQQSDTATNGGYRLVASNGAGNSVTRGCTLVVNPAPAPVGNTTIAIANQTSDSATFTPTWDTSDFAASLINGLSPSDAGPGNFTDPDVNPVSFNQAGGLPVLTDGGYGSIVNGGTHPAFATCGPTAGEYVIYTLPANANGYNLTNILVASGWNDDGRNANWCTVSYSTVANPGIFLPLAVVTNRPTLGNKAEIRATITPVAGALANNVYALMVSFEWPQGIPNGYSGFSQINAFGSPSASLPPAGPVITLQHEENTDSFVLETPNLIANQLPGSFGSGVFTLEGCAQAGMTDGVLSFGGNANSASCGANGLAVPWVIFNSGTGWDLTNIVVYSLWHDYGRDGQFYNVSYSTVSAPTTFVPLASVVYNPFVPHDGRASGNRVAIAPAVGQFLLASNVAAVKFDFTLQGGQDFGWSGYSEIVLQGSNLAAPALPVVSSTAAGGNLILTGTGGTPNYGYTILTSTDLLAPVGSWTVSATGVTDGTGAFSNAIPINVSQPARFFRIRML